MKTSLSPATASRSESFAQSAPGSSFQPLPSSPPWRESPESTGDDSGRISTPSPIRIRRLESGVSPDRGLLDTSVVIGIDAIERERLPLEIAISALTLAELTSGPHATRDSHERGVRQELLQRVEAGIETLSFDSECARAFGRICAATVEAGGRIGGSRMIDLMIAGVALSYRMPLYTLNAADLKGLEGLVEVVDLG